MGKVEVLLRDGNNLQHAKFSEFEHDAVHVRTSDCEVWFSDFRHTTFSGPHGDAIQLIPEVEGKSNWQYGLAYMENIVVSGCTVHAPNTDLQGVFAGDGLFYNLVFENNVIHTRHHGITINGALRVKARNNIGVQKYYPAKVGGGVYPKKLWIIGFAEDYINYEPIDSDTEVQDFRTSVFNDEDIFLDNFRYEDFCKARAEVENADGNTAAATFYNLALQYGDKVMGENVIYAQPIEDQPKNKKRKDLLQVVTQELNNYEIAGAEHNPEVVKYWSATWYKATNDDEAWCAAFMNWCLREAGLPSTGNPRALDFLNWGKKCKPYKGCIMVRDYGNGRGHVALLVDETDTHYRIVGGNQANRVGADWWPKTGMWHARHLKRVKFSKTSWAMLLEGLGVTGVGGKIASDATTTSVEQPNGESVAVQPPSETEAETEAETEGVTEAVVVPEFKIPDGYILLPEATVSTGLLILGAYVVVSLGIKIIVFRDRLKNIFNYGV